MRGTDRRDQTDRRDRGEMPSAERLARLREECRTRGLRMTPQREALLRLLSRMRRHPTADELYRGVRKSLPSVSPATVYRNVQQLAQAGVISTLDRPGAQQYDANRDEHHHFICELCGTIVDVYLERVTYRVDERRSLLRGSVVHGCDVQLRGRCALCRRVA
jgi:Fur family peroxide stress response transcriptional regulator